jgi:hypothetical protein
MSFAGPPSLDDTGGGPAGLNIDPFQHGALGAPDRIFSLGRRQ